MKLLRSNFSRHLVPLLIFALLTPIMTFPLIFHLSDHLPSDLGDTLHHVWLIGRNLQKAKEGFTNFWDGKIFYPHQKTLLYGDYVPALALLGAIPALLTENLIFTYNFLWLLSFFLCAVGVYFLVVHLTRSRSAAFIAGLIFAFSPIRFAHLSHLELLYSAWLPFCFLFLHKFFQKPGWGNLAATGFFLILQALSCGHYGIYAAFFMILFGIGLAIKTGLWKRPVFWIKSSIGAAVVACLLLPIFLPYLEVHQKMHFFRSIQEVRYYSAEIQHYLSVPDWNRLWGRVLDTKAIPEHQVFPGIIPFIFLLAWLVINRKHFSENGYRPFFFNLFISWFSLNRKCPEKGKGLAFFLLFLDIIIFIIIADLLVILSTGGFRVAIGGITISSRRLNNPLLILGFLLLLRVTVHPGCKAVRRKITLWLAINPASKNYSGAISSSPNFLRPSSSLIYPIYDLYITMALSSWLLSLGPVIAFQKKKLLTGPYEFLFRWVPGFQSIRVPSRFSVMLTLALAVLVGLGVASLLRPGRILFRKKWLLAALAGLVLLEEASFPIPLAALPERGRIPPIYSTIKDIPGEAVLLELPLPQSKRTIFREALPMYYALFHGKPLVNGYSGCIPPAYLILREAMEQFPTEETINLLRELKISLLLVHTAGFRKEKGREMVDRLKKWRAEIILLDHKEGDFLYAVSPVIISARTAFEGKRGEQTVDSLEEKIIGDSPKQDGLKPLVSKSNWRVWASSNVVMASRAVDGLEDTGWSTAGTQRRGDFFWVDLGHEFIVGGVEMSLNPRLFDYPRNFLVEGSNDKLNWRVLKECRAAFPQLRLDMVENFAAYRMRVSFEPTRLRFLRIRLTASHPLYHWSIQELECLGEEIEPDGK